MSTAWQIVLHGGAGVTRGRDYSAVEAHLGALVRAAAARLAEGMAAIDLVEWAVADMEASGLYVAGRGSAPNSAGVVELDASIMDGARHRAGAICAASGIASPVGAARQVLEQTPHILLAGEGATIFSRTHGDPGIADPAAHYVVPIGVEAAEMTQSEWSLTHGTVGAVALDATGRLAAATSTGGLFGKLAGRVGDTGVPGIGTWADHDVAISCTGIGEAFMLAGGAGDVAARMRYGGVPLSVAAQRMIDRVKVLGGDGGLIAVDRSGAIATPFNSGGMKRAIAGANRPVVVAIE